MTKKELQAEVNEYLDMYQRALDSGYTVVASAFLYKAKCVCAGLPIPGGLNLRLKSAE